jgi:hypothetical protein
MMKIKFALSAFVLVTSLLSTNLVQAADNGSGNNGNAGNGQGNNGSGNGNGASLPIDSGIVLLLAAGTIMGVMVVKNATKTVKV